MTNVYRNREKDPRINLKHSTLKVRAENFRRNMRKNSKRNPWRFNKRKPGINWPKMIAPLLIVLIPLMVMFVCNNVLLRMPDLYKYQMNSSEVLSDNMISADDEKVAELFSSYMMKKTDHFNMKEDLEYMPENLFNVTDGKVMHNVRDLLNREAAAAAALLAFIVAIYIYLYRKKEKDLILRNFNFSIAGFGVLSVINILSLVTGTLRNVFYGSILDYKFPKDDLLTAILDQSFFWRFAAASVILGLVMMAVFLYITYSIAGRNNMFRR